MGIAIGAVIGSVIVAILHWLVSLVLELFGTILQAFGTEFVNNFGSFDLFNNYFEASSGNTSWMTSINNTFIGIGIGFCSLLLILGLVRNILSGLGFAGESPFQMVGRLIIAIAFTYKLKDALNWVYSNVFKVIFIKIGEGFDIIDKIDDTSGMSATLSGNVVTTILMLFFTVIILKKLLEVIAEFVERYLLCAFLVFVAPLVACAMVLKTTMKVFSSYLKMFFGQAMILIMSSVTLQMIIVCMRRMIEKESTADGFMEMLMPLLITYAFLRIAARIDNYMKDIGLTVGVTGGDMFTDLRSAALSVVGMGRSISSAVGGFAHRAPGAANNIKSGFNDSKGANYMASANRIATDKASFGSAIANAAETASKNFGQKEGTNPYGGVFGGVKQALGMGKPSPAQKFGDGFNFRDANGIKDGIKQVENPDGSMSKMWRQTDSNGNSHLFEMSDKKMDGPGTSQFTAANGQKSWIKDHNVAAAVSGDKSELNDAMSRFDKSDAVVSNPEISTDNASTVGERSDSNISCNNQSVADAFNSMEENGANVADFQATAAAGVEVSPETLETAHQMKDARMQSDAFMGAGGHGEYIEDTGATVVSASDVAAGEAIRDSGLSINPTSVGVVDSLNDSGIVLSPEAINAGVTGASQGVDISKAAYSAMVADLGANYGYNSSQSLEFANIGQKYGLDSNQTFDIVGKIHDSGYQVNSTSITSIINAQREGNRNSVKNILNDLSVSNKNIRKIKKKKR